MTGPRITRLKHHAPQSYSDVILADSPLAFWRCEDAFAGGSLADSSGNGRTMTLNGTRSLGAKSKNARLGSTVSFRDAVGYGSIAAAAWHQITGDLTLECWANVHDAAATLISLLTCTSAGSGSANNRLYQWQLFKSGGVPGFGFYQESGSNVAISPNIQTPWEWTPGRWHHLALVRDAAALTYTNYADGVPIATVSYAANATGGGNGELNLGRVAATAGDIGPVAFDGVAIYGAALSRARIFEHYRAGRDIIGAWEKTALLCPFDGADTATACPDESSFGHVLTFAGAAQLDTAQSKFGGSSVVFTGGANVDRVNVASYPELTLGTADFCIEFFFRTNSIAAAIQIMYDQRSTTGGTTHPTILLALDKILFAHSGPTRITSGSVVANTWYHFCLQRLSGLTRMFVDGVQAGADYADATSYLANGIAIGNAGHAPTSPAAFDGWIDMLRVTVGAARYDHAGFTPPAAAFNPYE